MIKTHLDINCKADIIFNNEAKVILRGHESYLTKWFCDDEFIGEMNLSGGQWGAYPIKVGNWKIELHREDKVYKGELNIENRNVLFIYNFQQTKGKLPDINEMVSYISELRDKYKIIPYVYFKDSEKFILPFKTLKMNENGDFVLIIEKNG
jgi:hypothetical protein